MIYYARPTIYIYTCAATAHVVNLHLSPRDLVKAKLSFKLLRGLDFFPTTVPRQIDFLYFGRGHYQRENTTGQMGGKHFLPNGSINRVTI